MNITRLFAISMIYTIATWAQASSVNWEIKFFNENGNLVGDGEFSYDPDTIVSISTDSPDPSHIPDVINVNTSITSLDWKFRGTTLWRINTERSSVWWGGGSLIHTRDGSYFGPFILGESQEYSGGSRGNTFIRLGFDTNTDLIATGSWEQNANFTIGNFSGSGSWC